MRSHNAILRKIAELNLDPKIPYVSDGNRNMIPKFKKEEKIDYILGKRKEDESASTNEDNFILNKSEDIEDKILEEEVKESSNKKENTEISEDTNKKKFPFQKKKS